MVKWRKQVSMSRKGPCHFKSTGSKQQCDITAKTSLWSLPNEILVHILRSLHIKDLLSLKPAHRQFCDLVDNHSSIWTSVSFTDVWPSKHNLQYFDRAAKHGNIEALIKLGVAYLYNEGLPGDFEGKKITVNGERAAKMFCQAESQLSGIVPFTFLFIRPPWSALTRGACCKEYVFNNMVDYVTKHPVASVHQSIARTLSLLEDETPQTHMVYHLQKAADLRSSHAKYILWQKKYFDMKYPSIRQKVHELSQFAVDGCSIGAKLELCRAYAKGQYGKLSQNEAAAFVSKFVQDSKPTRINKMFDFQELTHSMRYILLDWLVEVANMKDYCSLTLHLAIHAVDRFLMRQRTTRAQLQLLGVSAMVLCSRFLGKDIITIREAAWLTDNTYKYEDVVRMMGEITATLRGNFRVLTSLDYVQVISLSNETDKPDNRCCYFSEYICELALLQSDLGELTQGKIAAVCVLLARSMLGKEHVWPKKLEQFTGFSLSDLKFCAADVHNKCFSEPTMTDHRSVELVAVKHRYADEEFMEVSDIPILPHRKLCELLGVVYPEVKPFSTPKAKGAAVGDSESRPTEPADIITSPSRSTPKHGRESRSRCSPLKGEKNVTPILEKKLSANCLNDMSGYLGDKEDEGDTNAMFDDDSDLDLESLWCVDNIDISYDMAAADDEYGMSDRTITPVNDYDNEVMENNGANNFMPIDDVLSELEKRCPVSPQFDKVADFVKARSESDVNSDEAGLLASPNAASLYNLSPQVSSVGLVKSNDQHWNVNALESSAKKAFSKEMNNLKSDNGTEHAKTASNGVLNSDLMLKSPNDTISKSVKKESLVNDFDSNASPTPTTSLMTTFNGSPIGGMNLFKVDTPNSTRYINSGIKIDFSNRKKASLSVLNLGSKDASSQRHSLLNALSKSKSSKKGSQSAPKTKSKKKSSSKSNNTKIKSNAYGQCENEPKDLVVSAISDNHSNSLGKSTISNSSNSNSDSAFKVFEDSSSNGNYKSSNKSATVSNSGSSDNMSNRQQSLKERSVNICDIQKRSKKRKPSVSIGNEEKIQVISNN